MHLSIDILNLRLDGLKAVTLSDCDGWLARLYNKGATLRSETVVSGGVVTLDQALLLMQRGLTERQLILDIRRELRHLLKGAVEPPGPAVMRGENDA
jgi:hypothetical protein